MGPKRVASSRRTVVNYSLLFTLGFFDTVSVSVIILLSSLL